MADIIERIGKLMLQAQDQNISETERSVFRDKALVLAKREQISVGFAIDRAKQGAKQAPRTERPKDRFSPKLKAPMMQRMHLAHYVFRFAGCETLRFGRGRQLKLAAFGFADDIKVAKLLWESLDRQGEMACAEAWSNRRVDEVRRTFQRTFWEQFSSVIYFRLEQIAKATVQEAEETQPGSAVALRTQEDEIKSWVAGMFPKTGKTRNSAGTRKYSAGRSAGREAGYRADLGQPKLTR